MIDRLTEICALGDKVHELCSRLRAMLRLAPGIEEPRVGQAYRDANGQWWCIGVWACASETEADILVNRLSVEGDE